MTANRSGRRTALLIGVLAAATCVTGIVDASVRSGSSPSASIGRLAPLLDEGHADVVAAAVAPAQRAVLSADRLRAGWASIGPGVGAFLRVRVTDVVRSRDGSRTELEVLDFDHGVGTLTARRTADGIVAMWLLVGTSDAAAQSAGATVANDLVAAHYDAVVSKFNAAAAKALSRAQLELAANSAFGDVLGPPTIAAQVVIRRPPTTTVETYLLFHDGLRRVEVTFDPAGRIAGLYLRPI